MNAALLCLPALALGLACCSSRSQNAGHEQQEGGSKQLGASDVQGRWRVVSIDGDPVGRLPGGSRPAYLEIAPGSVGGSLGCNSFGGLALFADGRLALHSWSSDAMGCPGKLGQQEHALSDLFSGRPHIGHLEKDRLRVHSVRHEVVLEPIGPVENTPVATNLPTLTGTLWRIDSLDEWDDSGGAGPGWLRFGPGGWQGVTTCNKLSGSWRSEGDRLIISPNIPKSLQHCPSEARVIDSAFERLMRSNPRYLLGPNGELLIAGGGHILKGTRER